MVPKTFVTDRELALMNALSTLFVDDDNFKFLLCQCHISKNILPDNERSLQDLQPLKFLKSTGIA